MQTSYLFQQMVMESRPLVPLIGFLAMGSDPTPSIETTAKRMENICESISMGQGQEVHARKLIDRALKEVISCQTYNTVMSEIFKYNLITSVGV